MSLSNFLRSSTFRLSLFYVGLFVTSVLLLFVFIYWSTARYMAAQTDSTIVAEIQTLANRYQDRGLPGLHQLIAERVERQRPTGTSIYLLTDFRSQIIVGNINRWPAVPEEDGWLNFELDTGLPDGASIHPARARQFRLTGGYRLLVGKDIYELKRTRLRIINTLTWGLLFTLALGLGGGIVMSRRLLNRIEQINETSRKIMDGDLSQRVPHQSSGNEVDQLADNLNLMFDQIESLMENTRRVSDNIAHDLRSPLSRLRQQLESLRDEQFTDKTTRSDLDNALQEADQLLNTFNAVLRIARIESGSGQGNMVQLNLQTLASDVVELYEPLAEEKRQHLTCQLQENIRIKGDRDMLFQAFANMLDNAIKYTPIGGIIVAACARDRNTTYFSVSDNGPGIEPGNRENVFQRFYRLDQSRSAPGNGLGLSLVRAVADLHGASVDLADAAPGLAIRFTLPD